jgi:hypothetical protein
MLNEKVKILYNKSELPIILGKWGFTEIYEWRTPNEYRGECIIGFESPKARISLYYED